MFHSTIENTVSRFKSSGDYEGFEFECISTLGIEPEMGPAFFRESKDQDVVNELAKQFYSFYNRKEEGIKEVLMPLLKTYIKTRGKNINGLQFHFQMVIPNRFQSQLILKRLLKQTVPISCGISNVP